MPSVTYRYAWTQDTDCIIARVDYSDIGPDSSGRTSTETMFQTSVLAALIHANILPPEKVAPATPVLCAHIEHRAANGAVTFCPGETRPGSDFCVKHT